MHIEMFIFFIVICCLPNILSTSYLNSSSHNVRKRHVDMDEATSPTPLIVQKYGYPSELHQVVTEDGYVLEMHRIPYGKKSPPCRRKPKPAVLLMHDIISSSADFILNGPNKSLGYILADSGFDVWMGNFRGNRYSRNHRTMTTQTNSYWDFSFHEMGYRDIPAMINYMLEKTGNQKILYVGHSMATTAYFVLMSERPEYNSKIQASFLMSPVAYLNNMKSPILKFGSFFSNTIGLFLDIIGVGEFLPKFELLSQLGRFICKGGDPTQPICSGVLFLLSGYNLDNLDMERFPIYTGHVPAGTATKVFIHYGQISQSGKFRKMGLGIVEDFMKFGGLLPDLYNLKGGRIPVYLFYSVADWFAGAADVDTLYKELREGTAVKIEVKDPQFAHVDFTYGQNAKVMVYDNLISLMKKHTP